jgi:hypothetical protein
MVGEHVFQRRTAANLTTLRIQARQKRRLTYDCMSAIVKAGSDGELVVCKEGHQFPKLGRQEREGFPLHSVLEGRSSSICQHCGDFDQETTE